MGFPNFLSYGSRRARSSAINEFEKSVWAVSVLLFCEDAVMLLSAYLKSDLKVDGSRPRAVLTFLLTRNFARHFFLLTRTFRWIPATYHRGKPFDGSASHPGGTSSNPSSRLTLQQAGTSCIKLNGRRKCYRQTLKY